MYATAIGFDLAGPFAQIDGMATREFDIIREIRKSVFADPLVLVGIGDDTAVLAATEGETLITTDMLLEGVHFDLSTATLRQVGRKAMAVNLSDIAAMAGAPTAAVVAVGLPADAPDSLAKELHTGIAELADEFGVALVGGDTNRSNGGLVVCITVLGKPTGRGPLLRSGAKPGDAICVTGSLGGSILGNHLTFTPRIREAQWLHKFNRLHSLMDLSDGLGGDLFHILDESKCGAVLNSAAIPISDAAATLAGRDGKPPLDHALNDGEDFELLFTLSDDWARALCNEQPLKSPFGVKITTIGKITSNREVWIETDGNRRELPRGGFIHSV